MRKIQWVQCGIPATKERTETVSATSRADCGRSETWRFPPIVLLYNLSISQPQIKVKQTAKQCGYLLTSVLFFYIISLNKE